MGSELWADPTCRRCNGSGYVCGPKAVTRCDCKPSPQDAGVEALPGLLDVETIWDKEVSINENLGNIAWVLDRDYKHTLAAYRQQAEALTTMALENVALAVRLQHAEAEARTLRERLLPAAEAEAKGGS